MASVTLPSLSRLCMPWMLAGHGQLNSKGAVSLKCQACLYLHSRLDAVHMHHVSSTALQKDQEESHGSHKAQNPRLVLVGRDL